MSLNDSKLDTSAKTADAAVAVVVPVAEKPLPTRRRWRDDEESTTDGEKIVPEKSPVEKADEAASDTLKHDKSATSNSAVKKTAIAKSNSVPSPPPPPPAATDQPAAVPVVNISRGRFRMASRLLKATPSWLVSGIVHLVALISLSLVTIGGAAILKQTTLVARVAPESDTFSLQNIEFVSPSQHSLEFDANDISMEAVGLAEFDGVADGNPNAIKAAMSDIEVASTGNAGDMFGNGGGGKNRPNMDKYIAEFYGVKAEGKKFVFILDSSGSMRGGKFDDARRELMYSIAKLNKEQFFYVIFFDALTHPMILGSDNLPPDAPVPASLDNVKKLEQWVTDSEVGSYTNPFEAVRAAVEMKPDAIYILSDGKFTDEGRTVKYLQTANMVRDAKYGRKPKVVIHTIGFYSHEGEEALRKIAARYGGTYRFIADPNGRKR